MSWLKSIIPKYIVSKPSEKKGVPEEKKRNLAAMSLMPGSTLPYRDRKAV
jgi:hypothetical protein